MMKKERFSIRKLNVGVASVLIGIGFSISGGLTQVGAETVNDRSAIFDSSNENKMVEDSRNSETNEGTKENYSGVQLSGNIVGGHNTFTVGEQIISTFKLDVSAPSKLENGSYILITLPTNEPVIDVQIGTALPYEKVSDTVYKIKTNEVSGGSYATVNVSYKFDKFRTGRNSSTTINAAVYSSEGMPISSTSTVASVTNTNSSGYPYVSVDSNDGAKRQVLFETDAPGTSIDENKNKLLTLKLTTTNKEVAAINKIQHSVVLPDKVKIAPASLNAGWVQEGNIARFERTIGDAQAVFSAGNNATDDTLILDMRDAGTLEEFLAGKNFQFSDTATYTDKSGETNTSSGSVELVVGALNPYKDNGPGAKPDTAEGVNPLILNNYTRENTNNSVINTAIPGIKADDDDRRIIVIWRSGATPTKIKEVEIDIQSDFDQKRSVEFYGIWARGNAYAPWYAPNDLKTSNTFEVFTVNGTTETRIGEIAFKQGGGTSVDLPDGTTKVILRPKRDMEFTDSELTQVGVYLVQNLRGLEDAKKMLEAGEEVNSIVTARVSTVGSDTVNEAISKTTLVDARTALKLVPRTSKIDTVLSGNTTQGFAAGVEAYNYSPAGLGGRVYNTLTSHLYDTAKSLKSLGMQNPKIIVELPDGFTYAGIKDRTANNALIQRDSVKVDDNYENTGKRVVIISTDSDYFNTRDDVRDGNYWNNKYLDLAFNVANWVPTGTYSVKYTLVWDENEALLGLNPNDEFEGSTKILNTTSFSYAIPVSNTSATQLVTEVTDKNDKTSGFTTELKNLAPNAEVTYKFTLSNRDNSSLKNNEVLVTLPRLNDKNIVDTTVLRNSQFNVVATGAAQAPEGWTAYYSTSEITGDANTVASSAMLTADQITDWSKVTAVKFVSNDGTTLNPGLSTAFLLPARISAEAKDGQIANISAAAKTDQQTVYNEANVASLTIKIDNIQTGNVKVAYENTQGATIKDTVTAIEKRAYTKDYNVDTADFKPTELTGNDGKKYYFVKVKEESAATSGVIDSEERTVTYVYDLLEEETEETKTVTRTIHYLDADTREKVSDPVTQTVTITRTNVKNKVTGAVTNGTWSEASWEEQTSPTVANYEAPDRAKVDKVDVNENTETTVEVVRYTKKRTNLPETPEEQLTPEQSVSENPNTSKTNSSTEIRSDDYTYMLELPNTGTGGEMGIFGAAATAILAGLGLTISPVKRNENDN